jgi:hypothetical protein
MRLVAVKSSDQQAVLILHRTRTLLLCQRAICCEVTLRSSGLELKYTIAKLRHARFGQSSEWGALLKQLGLADLEEDASADEAKPQMAAVAAASAKIEVRSFVRRKLEYVLRRSYESNALLAIGRSGPKSIYETSGARSPFLRNEPNSRFLSAAKIPRIGLLWHEASTSEAVIYLGADLSCRQNATHSRDIDRLLNHLLGRPCP